MDLGITDKVFVLVGGTLGMGYAAATVLAEDGARVALVARDEARASTKAAELAAATGAIVIAVGADGTQPGSVERAIQHVHERLGRIDGLAVTAGPVTSRSTLADATDEMWDEYFQNQMMATMRSCRAVLPLLVAGGGGTIVTTSAYSIRSTKETLIAYTAMKSAVATYTKSMAKTFGRQGVRANCVAPGAIGTEALMTLADEAIATYGGSAEDALGRLMEDTYGMHVAMGRVGRPREVGELIALLLSPRAGYLTGALINIDGGTDF